MSGLNCSHSQHKNWPKNALNWKMRPTVTLILSQYTQEVDSCNFPDTAGPGLAGFGIVTHNLWVEFFKAFEITFWSHAPCLEIRTQSNFILFPVKDHAYLLYDIFIQLNMFAEKYNKIIKEIFTRIIKMAIITLGNIGTFNTVLNESLPSIITLETSLDLSMCPQYAWRLVGR